MFASLKAVLKETFQGANESGGRPAGVEARSLIRPEGERHFLVAAPSRPATGKRALVIIMHGAGASAKQVLGMAFPPSPLSVWLEIAEREQLMVAAPDAGKGGWSDCMASAQQAARKDDVAFISAIIDQAIAQDEVDPARVYAIGVSRGGFMAYRVAMELSERLAAFSTVLASMPPAAKCSMPPIALSALIVGCTGDRLMPYHGGKFFYSPLDPVSSIEESAAMWRRHAGLPDVPQVQTIAQFDPRVRTQATCYLWGSAPERVQVSLIRIDNAGHAEPSRRKRYPQLINWLVGTQNTEFEVADTAWEFFRYKRAGMARSEDVHLVG